MYFDRHHDRIFGQPLPWRDLRAAFTERGWVDMTHVRRELEVGGVRIAAGGRRRPAHPPGPLRHRRGRAEPRRATAARADPLAGAARSRPLRRGRIRPGARRSHPRRPVVPAVLRRTGDELRHRSVEGEGSVTLGCAHAPTRIGWGRHLAVRSGAVLLPPGGEPADVGPDAAQAHGYRPRAGRFAFRGGRALDFAGRFRERSVRRGVWRSLVARFVRDEEVVGSNPATPTRSRRRRALTRGDLVRASSFHGWSIRCLRGPSAVRPQQLHAQQSKASAIRSRSSGNRSAYVSRGSAADWCASTSTGACSVVVVALTPGRFRTRAIAEGVTPACTSTTRHPHQAVPQGRTSAPYRNHDQRHPRLRDRQRPKCVTPCRASFPEPRLVPTKRCTAPLTGCC